VIHELATEEAIPPLAGFDSSWRFTPISHYIARSDVWRARYFWSVACRSPTLRKYSGAVRFTLGKHSARLPDGERGGWLPGEDFRRTRGLVEGRGQSLLSPPISRTVRMSAGTSTQDLAFETLHYLPNARASYAVFSRGIE
jgi:hypothetical protein